MQLFSCIHVRERASNILSPRPRQDSVFDNVAPPFSQVLNNPVQEPWAYTELKSLRSSVASKLHRVSRAITEGARSDRSDPDAPNPVPQVKVEAEQEKHLPSPPPEDGRPKSRETTKDKDLPRTPLPGKELPLEPTMSPEESYEQGNPLLMPPTKVNSFNSNQLGSEDDDWLTAEDDWRSRISTRNTSIDEPTPDPEYAANKRMDDWRFSAFTICTEPPTPAADVPPVPTFGPPVPDIDWDEHIWQLELQEWVKKPEPAHVYEVGVVFCLNCGAAITSSPLRRASENGEQDKQPAGFSWQGCPCSEKLPKKELPLTAHPLTRNQTLRRKP